MSALVWKAMEMVFAATLAGGFAFGYFVGGRSWWWGAVGVAGAFAAFFVGAVLAMVKAYAERREIVRRFTETIAKIKGTADELVGEHRKLCAGAVIAVAEAAVRRVVGRVVSEHRALSSNEEQLEAALEEAKVIVDQELKELTRAVKDEAAAE